MSYKANKRRTVYKDNQTKPVTKYVQHKRSTQAHNYAHAARAYFSRPAPTQMKQDTPTDDTNAVHDAAQKGVSGSGGALPHLDHIQAMFGAHDISQVQAHTDANAAEATKTMGAEAYATGNNIAFGGKPSLHTAAHEAAHIVQQRAGVQLEGGVGQVGDVYEQHADAVADAVVQGKSAEGLLDSFTGQAPVQRKALQLKDAAPNYEAGETSEKAKEGDKEKESEEKDTPQTKEEVKAALEGKPVVVPIKAKQTINLGEGFSMAANINVSVHLSPEAKVTGSFSGVLSGTAGGRRMSKNLGHNFDTGDSNLGVSLDNLTFVLKHSDKSTSATAKMNIMQAVMGGAAAEVTQKTGGAVTLTASGIVGLTWLFTSGADWGRLSNVNANITLGGKIDVLKLAQSKHDKQAQEGMKNERGEIAPEDQATYDAAKTNGGGGNSPGVSTEHTATMDNDSTATFEGGNEMGLAAGAEVSFNVNTNYGDDGEVLSETTTEGKTSVVVHIGPFKITLSAQDKGKAIGSPDERRKLEEAAAVHALDLMFAGIPAELKSNEDRVKAAKAANMRFASAHKSHRAFAESKLTPEEGATNTMLPGLYKKLNRIFEASNADGVSLAKAGQVRGLMAKSEHVSANAARLKAITARSEDSISVETSDSKEQAAHESYMLLDGKYKGFQDEHHTSQRANEILAELDAYTSSFSSTTFVQQPRIQSRLKIIKAKTERFIEKSK